MHYSRRFAGFNYAAANSGAKPAGSFASGDNLWYSWNAGVSHPDRPCVAAACLSDTGRRLRQLIHFVTVNTEVWNCPQMDPEKGMGSGNCTHSATETPLAFSTDNHLSHPLARRRLEPEDESEPGIGMYQSPLLARYGGDHGMMPPCPRLGPFVLAGLTHAMMSTEAPLRDRLLRARNDVS